MSEKKTALQAVMDGAKVSDRQARTALKQAVDRVTDLASVSEEKKEAIAHTAESAVHMAETQGSLFMASMAEGYVGEDKLKVGSVDVRAPAGLAGLGWGLYQMLRGNRAAGGHSLAIGNGLLGSLLASVGVKAGRTLREQKGAPAEPTATVTPLPQLEGVTALLSEPVPEVSIVEGPMREVLLTPEPESARRRRSRPPRHFTRAEPDED